MAKRPLKFVGCYKQRARDLKAWAARGINLVVLWEPENGTVTQRVWRQAARDAGLVYIDTYLDDTDADDFNLLGWSLANSDEWNRARGPQSTRQPTAPLVAEAQKLAALNKAKGTNKLIFANADGPGVTMAMFEKPPYNGVKNNEKAVLPSLTLRSADWYPIVSIPNTQPSEIARRPLYLPAQAVWRLRTWSDEIGAQPAEYMAIIEAAKGWKSPLGITGDQMRETVDYLMGNRPFPVPDANGKPVTVQDQQIDILVFWTANGQDGPGWNWFASDADQESAIISIAADVKGGVVAPTPTPEPTPDPITALTAQVSTLQKQFDEHTQMLTDAMAKAAQVEAKLNDPATVRDLLIRALAPATQPTVKDLQVGGGK